MFFMAFYSFEMFLVGIILFSGMTAAAIKVWLKQRQNNSDQSVQKNDKNQKVEDRGAIK